MPQEPTRHTETRSADQEMNSKQAQRIHQEPVSSDSQPTTRTEGVSLQELEKAQKLADSYFTQLMYLQADFDNYRKQSKKEQETIIKQANQSLITELLVVLDDLERAIETLNDPKHRKGLGMVYAHLLKILTEHGLEPIDALGKKFDPYYHEALLKEPSDQPEDIVIQELRKGYLLNKKVIRYSQVKLSGGPSK